MKACIIKPDYKIHGGFEVVLDRIMEGIKSRNHDIDILKVDMTDNSLANDGFSVPEEIYQKNHEYFRYMLAYEKFKKIDVSRYDCIISTQPPSFATHHKNHISLFYHHMKIYYDLFDVVMEVGLVDRKLHELAAAYVREVDNKYLTNEKVYAVGSNTVKNRLKKYNNVTKNQYNFYAGINDEFYNYNGSISYDFPICVGRHEFPKRPELFIQAMKYLDIQGIVIGEGGKTERLKQIDHWLDYKYRYEKTVVDSTKLWKDLIFNLDDRAISNSAKHNIQTNVIFSGKVNKNELIRYYSQALCVVCPSYEEDYGLTAIEAMAFGKPVIACKDGGGYTELIEDGVTGFIVEPTGEAIASAIKVLLERPELLKTMSMNAYEESRKYSWDNAVKYFEGVLNMTMGE